MKHEIDLQKYHLRTDLVVEQIDENIGNEITTKVYEEDKIKITNVTVDQKASNILGKKTGEYITIEFEDVTDFNNKKNVKEILTIRDIYGIIQV